MWCVNTDAGPALAYQLQILDGSGLGWQDVATGQEGPIKFAAGMTYKCWEESASAEPHIVRAVVQTEADGLWSLPSNEVLVSTVPEPGMAGLVFGALLLSALSKWGRR